MTAEAIQEKVTAIVRDVLDCDTLVLTPDTTAAQVEDWDSLAHISIIVAIEREFGIRFELTELKPLENVGELWALIGAKISR